MTEPTIHLPLTASRADQVFPTLTSAQIGRIASHGHARSTKAGDVLLEQGDKNIPIFVVISGELETVRPSGARETLIANACTAGAVHWRKRKHAFRTACSEPHPGPKVASEVI